jgi:hypothetical protein
MEPHGILHDRDNRNVSKTIIGDLRQLLDKPIAAVKVAYVRSAACKAVGIAAGMTPSMSERVGAEILNRDLNLSIEISNRLTTFARIVTSRSTT